MSEREIRVAHLDKRRPVVILTRPALADLLPKLVVVPVGRRGFGLPSEVPLGTEAVNGLRVASWAWCDRATALSQRLVGDVIGHLTAEQETALRNALLQAYGMEP